MSCPQLPNPSPDENDMSWVDEEYENVFGADPDLDDEEFDLDYDDPPEMSYSDNGDVVYYCHNCGKELYDDDCVICGTCVQEGYYI